MPAIVGAGRTRPAICLCSSSVSLPRDTALRSEPSRMAMPLDRASASASAAVTVMPARARTSAIPAPIVPRPTTPAERISIPRDTTVSAMRLVIARCSVEHAGRLSAHLPPALRLLIVKADGSVLVLSDGGSYKAN